MPFIIQNLIPEAQNPIRITENETGHLALSMMIEHDFSQLPVVDEENIVQGMITSDSLLKALSYFQDSLGSIKVSHAMAKTKVCRIDDELSELLQALGDTSAIPIVDKQNKLKAIVTSYDTAEYFRRRAEDIMLAGDIETTLKDFIEDRHRNDIGELDAAALSIAIQSITASGSDLKSKFKSALLSYVGQTTHSTPTPDDVVINSVYEKYLHQQAPLKTFDKLTLSDFIQMFRNIWDEVSLSFQDLPWEAISQLLEGVRETRNAIAHFREITPQQREQLKFCAEFLDRHRPTVDIPLKTTQTFSIVTETTQTATNLEIVGNVVAQNSEINPTEEEPDHSDSRYAPLAVWLQSQTEDRVPSTFEEIETIIEDNLPPSARAHRTWWANDNVSHPQSIQWLEAGWRVSSVNMSSERVIFSRVEELSMKYICFFGELQDKLRHIDGLSVQLVGNQGRNWVCSTVKLEGETDNEGMRIVFSFARRSRFRIELYISERESQHNKPIFDLLHEQKNEIESQFGASLSWERLNGKMTSRIAFYRGNSSIKDSEEELIQVQNWATHILPKFYDALSEKFIEAQQQIIAEPETNSYGEQPAVVGY